MNVESFPCHYCKESICDCSGYVKCRCGNKWCEGTDCADKEGHSKETRTCSFCRMEDVEDKDLVTFLLKKLRLTRQQAILLYFGDYPEDDSNSSSN